MFRVKCVLHATDFSEASSPALHLARSLADDYSARLVLLHVFPPPVSPAEGVDYDRPDGLKAQLQDDLERLARGDSSAAADCLLAEGKPAAQIVRVANEEGCDLIVLGTHGRTGLRRALMGSVAEEVSRTARCPVVTVRSGVRVAESLPVLEGEYPEMATELGTGDPVREAVIEAGGVSIRGELRWPDHPTGVVVFAHGSGSSRHSPRNRFVAQALNEAGFATLLVDLLADTEDQDQRKVFDVSLLAERLTHAAGWVRGQPEMAGLPVGYFGASTGSAAALIAAAEHPDRVTAVVSRGGRPDLAGTSLRAVRAPTLLIVGGADEQVLGLNVVASNLMTCDVKLVVVPRATHLFPEPGALEAVADLAARWFRQHLSGSGG